MDAIIETRRLRKVYGRRNAPAVDALDLAVPRGQVFGFLGPNGAGKTTTIGMLLGNVFPTSGTGTMLGRPLGDREARRKVGYLPEKFQFHEFLTATEFLHVHGRLYGMDAAARKRRVPETLELVGLANRAGSRVREFSKGMQQRIGLAQAILHEPALVILDEPTSALDPLGRRAVRDLILHLKERGTTVLLNSHLLSEVERTCDQVAIIKGGRVVRQGTVDQITVPSSSVVVELEALTPALSETLARFGSVQTDTTRATVTLPDDTRIPDMVSALVAAGGRLQAVVPVRESLEEAFVRVIEEDQAPAGDSG